MVSGENYTAALCKPCKDELHVRGCLVRHEKGTQTQTVESGYIVWWGGGLPREGVGARKFGLSLETQGNQTFLAAYPGILLGYPGNARKA